jgi:ligand-binding sensor domain-containing protein/signal transduction histidine kinase
VVGLFLLPIVTVAQQPAFRFATLSIVNGLSENGVSSILQDRQGFLWFGTLDGLNRYDGYEFRTYRHRPFDSSAISQNRIACLADDRDNALWIGTSGGGLDRFDRGSQRFTHFRHRPGDSTSLANDYVTALSVDSMGLLWVGTLGGVHRWDTSCCAFLRFSIQREDLRPDSVLALATDHQGVVWIGSTKGLHSYHPDTKIFRYHRVPQDLIGSRGVEVRCLAEDSSGRIWIGTVQNGIFVYDPRNDRFLHFGANSPQTQGLQTNDIWSIVVSPRGMNHGVWVATGNGLYWSEGESNGVIHWTAIRNDPYDPSSLSGNEVWSLLLDRQGNLWIGTWQDGVCLLAPYRRKFQHFTHSPGDPRSLRSSNVNALFEDRSGNVWIGTLRDGLDKFDRASQRFTHPPELPPAPSDRTGRYHRCITSIVEDAAGMIWVSSWAGLYQMNSSGEVLKHFHHEKRNPRSLASNMINTLSVDGSGNLWIGFRGMGIDLLDLKKSGDGFFHERRQGDRSSSLSDNMVWVIAEGKDRALWVGTDRGLNRRDPFSGVYRQYLHDPANRRSLCNDAVFALWIPDSVTVWVGTTAGLDKLDLRSGGFFHYGQQDGLPSAYIYAILPDGQGNLWLSTNKGVARFREDGPPGRKSRNYGFADGLQGMEFSPGAAHLGRSGVMYLGGLNGYNAFRPQHIADNPHRPIVMLTAMTVGDSIIPLTERSGGHPVELTYPHRDFTIGFLPLEYTDPGRNQSRYRLQGFDGSWVDAGTRREATYTNLNPGRYTFAVRASNADGLWNEDGAVIEILVQPAYWETIWFKAALVLAVAGFLLLLYRLRVSRLLALERMRIQIASDLHDDIGSTLTKIAVHSEIIQDTDDPGTIRETSRKIGAASREIITTLSDIVWSIDARNDTVGDLLDRMRDFASALFAGKHIEYGLTAQGLDAPRALPSEVRQNLYLIFKEALTNIARHSNAQHVSIELTNSQNGFSMRIANDGESKEEGGGRPGHQGLQNMRMRARRIEADLAVEGPPGFAILVRRRRI